MVEKMQNVNIPWGYHTMVKKLEFNGGEYFIGKFVRKSDGFVSWHMHEAETGRCLTGAGMVTYEKNEDTDDNDDKSLKTMIYNFEKATHVEFASLL